MGIDTWEWNGGVVDLVRTWSSRSGGGSGQ